MNMNKIEQIIIPFLNSQKRHSELIKRFSDQKTRGHAFELYFAYANDKLFTKNRILCEDFLY